jgi:nucleoside-diphosphate-sugar epimerase
MWRTWLCRRAGFIGHHLVAELIAQGDPVSIIDGLSAGSADRLTG